MNLICGGSTLIYIQLMHIRGSMPEGDVQTNDYLQITIQNYFLTTKMFMYAYFQANFANPYRISVLFFIVLKFLPND